MRETKVSSILYSGELRFICIEFFQLAHFLVSVSVTDAFFRHHPCRHYFCASSKSVIRLSSIAQVFELKLNSLFCKYLGGLSTIVHCLPELLLGNGVA